MNDDTIRRMWDHMAELHQAELIHKPDALEMKIIAKALDRMGIVEHDAFMQSFATTVGLRIYLPFEPGDLSARCALAQAKLCAHEFQHVVQLEEEGTDFMWGYLRSGAYRAIKEGLAYTCNLEVHHWATGELLDCEELAQTLEHYACTEGDIAVCRAILRSAKVTVQDGGILNRSSREVISFLEGEGVQGRQQKGQLDRRK